MAAVSDWGIPWPVGYGAGPTIDELGVRALPTVVVADRNGQVVWTSAMRGSLEETLQRLLRSN